ncbi:nicotinate-nucleotide diphosphorylase (carboxylating), partial [Acinetobacter baumannii]
LVEDLGRAGDITTDAVVPPGLHATVTLTARQTGTVAGLDPAALAFRLIEPEVALSVERPDGSSVAAGQVIATVSGPARALLTAERT